MSKGWDKTGYGYWRLCQGRGARLYRMGRRWFLRYRGEVKTLSIRATFDAAERALGEMLARRPLE